VVAFVKHVVGLFVINHAVEKQSDLRCIFSLLLFSILVSSIIDLYVMIEIKDSSS
jgi:hypothetical protein